MGGIYFTALVNIDGRASDSEYLGPLTEQNWLNTQAQLNIGIYLSEMKDAFTFGTEIRTIFNNQTSN